MGYLRVCEMHISNGRLTVAVLITLTAFCANGYGAYQLVWSDEFDGSSLNMSNWSHQEGDGCPALCGWGNNELEYYRSQNTTVSGGNLIITAKAENYGGRNYTSGKIISRNKQDFLYGKIEARMQVVISAIRFNFRAGHIEQRADKFQL